MHLDHRSHPGSIAIVEGVDALRQAGCSRRFDRQEPRPLAVLQILAQEREGDPGEVRAATNTSDHHIGIFICQVHLF
jgi:hypothetical protein